MSFATSAPPPFARAPGDCPVVAAHGGLALVLAERGALACRRLPLQTLEECGVEPAQVIFLRRRQRHLGQHTAVKHTLSAPCGSTMKR